MRGPRYHSFAEIEERLPKGHATTLSGVPGFADCPSLYVQRDEGGFLWWSRQGMHFSRCGRFVPETRRQFAPCSAMSAEEAKAKAKADEAAVIARARELELLDKYDRPIPQPKAPKGAAPAITSLSRILTGAESKDVQALAEASGKSVEQWFRDVILSAASAEKDAQKKEQAEAFAKLCGSVEEARRLLDAVAGQKDLGL